MLLLRNHQLNWKYFLYNKKKKWCPNQKYWFSKHHSSAFYLKPWPIECWNLLSASWCFIHKRQFHPLIDWVVYLYKRIAFLCLDLVYKRIYKYFSFYLILCPTDRNILSASFLKSQTSITHKTIVMELCCFFHVYCILLYYHSYDFRH